MKILFALILAFAMLVSLAACGGKDDPNLGKYNAVSCTVMGFELGCDGEYIELSAGGKAKISLGGDEYSGKWELDGEDITIKQSGDKFEGTLINGVLTVDFAGMVYTYEKEGGKPAKDKGDSEGGISASIQDKNGEETAAPSAPAASAASSELGVYVGSTYEYAGQVYNMYSIYNSDCTLELREGGTGTLTLDGQEEEISWSLDGEDFSFTMNYVDSEGTLVDGVISFNYMGMGMIMTFEKEDVSSSNAASAPAHESSKPSKPTVEAPSAEPAAAESPFAGANSWTVCEAMSRIETVVNFTLPASMWVAECPNYTLYLYNVESLDVAHSASPRIQFTAKESLEKLNFYINDFKNLQEIESRTIGGLEMQGRTYTDVGMEWIEYYAELSNGVWMSIKISKTSVEPGSEGSAILDSVTFG